MSEYLHHRRNLKGVTDLCPCAVSFKVANVLWLDVRHGLSLMDDFRVCRRGGSYQPGGPTPIIVDCRSANDRKNGIAIGHCVVGSAQCYNTGALCEHRS